MPRPPTTLFEDAIDVPAWLEEDRARPLAERMQRDRAVARKLGDVDRSAQAVRRWWREVRPEKAGTGERLERARRLIGLGTVLVGAFAGASLALAAFQYDGTHPVNVVRVLALLVALPLALLVPTLLLLVPGGPLRPVQDALAAINVGALAAAVARRVARPSPEIARLFDFGAARAGAVRRFAKWQMLYWSQLAGVGFAVAALATAVTLVTFTDLAFGWSTTLAVDSDAVSRIVRALAWPWRQAVPEAVPSPALIEQSQYFRYEAGRGGGPAASALTEWWPFVLLAVTTYTLLPRLLLLAVARTRLRAATRALLLDDPGVAALLDRMTAPGIESASPDPEQARRTEPLAAGTAGRHLSGRAHAVIWSEAITPAAAHGYARRLGLELEQVVQAGGSRALAEDREALEALGGGVRSLLVFTPAWEPPLLELLDFLAEVRRRVGDDASIVVTPVGENGGAPSEIERDTWSRAVARVPDPRLYVEAGAA